MLRCLSHAYKVDGAVRVGYLSLLFSDGTNEDLPRDRFARLHSGKLQRSTAGALEECDRKGAVWFDGPLVTGFQKISSGHVRLWFNGERSFVLFSLQEALKMLEHQDAASLIDREIMSTKELTIGSRGDVPDLSGGGALKLPLQSRRPLPPMTLAPPTGGYQVLSSCLQAAFLLLTGPLQKLVLILCSLTVGWSDLLLHRRSFIPSFETAKALQPGKMRRVNNKTP